MKKLLTLLTMIASFTHAEVINLDCHYKDNSWNSKKIVEYQQKFTIDTQLKRLYEYETAHVLEIRPHHYIAYPLYLFSNDELLLTEKGIYPNGKIDYIFNRKHLGYYAKNRAPSRIMGGQCTVVGGEDLLI